MKLTCNECGALVPAVDINLATGWAKCSACNALFQFPSQDDSASRSSRTTRPNNEIFPQPPQMIVDDWGGSRRISWRWFNWSYIPLAGFCIVWDGFLVFWYSMAFGHNGPLIMKLFPIMHVAVGISLSYTVLTGFLNRTSIEINDLELLVRHGPLPWVGNRRLASGQIQQLFCERTWTQNNNRSGGPRYQVCATMGEGKKVRVVGGMQYLGEARFLEQLIETRLGIKDVPVVGECVD